MAGAPQELALPAGVSVAQFRDAWQGAVAMLTATWYGVPLDPAELLAHCDPAVLAQVLACTCLTLMKAGRHERAVEDALREWGAATAMIGAPDARG